MNLDLDSETLVDDLFNAQQEQLAITELNSRLTTNQDDARIPNLLAQIYYRLGELDIALICLYKAAKFLPSMPDEIKHNLEIYELMVSVNRDGVDKIWKDANISSRDIRIQRYFLSELLNRKRFKEAQVLSESIVALPESVPSDMIGLREALEGQRWQAEREYFHKRYKNYGPLIFVHQGHSAGNYVSDELERRLGTFRYPEPLLEGSESDNPPFMDELERYAEFGGLWQTHLFPRPVTLMLLRYHGLKNLVVNVRDPRQVVFSNTHWMQDDWERDFKYSREILKLRLSKNFFEKPFSERLDEMIENDLPYFINWLMGWYKAANDASSELKIHFVRFEDLKTDYDSYFKSILKAYNIDWSEFKGERYESKRATVGRIGEHAFRRGALAEWREEMTQKQKDRMREKIPPELITNFGWDPW